MIKSVRKKFNSEFTQEKYEQFLHHVNTAFGETTTFRIAETPVFVPKYLKRHLLAAVKEICATLEQPDLKAKSDAAIPPHLHVPNEDAHPTFLVLDFGICQGADGKLFPQLIELQGFPSLFFFQSLLAEAHQKAFNIPPHMTNFFGGLDMDKYVALLKDIIVGKTDPKQVVLLEIEPEKQNTRIDFWGTVKYLGIKVLCLSKVIKKGKNLYYADDEGKHILIKKIYNRIIFDELEKRTDLPRQWDMLSPVSAKWIGHPNWFFRISKHTLPFLNSKYVPETHFLHELTDIPNDLENWVLKPLFSFSGMGVNINVKPEDIAAVTDRSNYILQRKAPYLPVITSPNEPIKCEIRMMLVWKDNWKKPKLINNLIRLSKGEMVGVRYNKDKDWVGASVGFFE